MATATSHGGDGPDNQTPTDEPEFAPAYESSESR